MKQGCKYYQYNKYDGIYRGSNICAIDGIHIDPYAEFYCNDFKSKDDYKDLIIFDDQPQRQLKSPEIHND